VTAAAFRAEVEAVLDDVIAGRDRYGVHFDGRAIIEALHAAGLVVVEASPDEPA
jgi:hypothetical protein